MSENIEPDISKLVDNRSADVWEQLNNFYHPKLVFHKESFYRCVTDETNVEIYITDGNYNLNYFAHEILHLQLHMNGINIGHELLSLYRTKNSLIKVLSEQTIHNITNSFEHVKMFPTFISLGFDEFEFTVDYNIPKAQSYDLYFRLLDLDNNSVGSQHAAEDYINIFFSLKANSNKKLDYKNELLYLKERDAALYQILDDFWNAWMQFTIGNNVELSDLVRKFYSELERWILNKYPNLKV